MRCLVLALLVVIIPMRASRISLRVTPRPHPLTSPLKLLVGRYYPRDKMTVVYLPPVRPGCDIAHDLAIDTILDGRLRTVAYGEGAPTGRRPGSNVYLSGLAQGYLVACCECDGDLLVAVAALRRLPLWNCTARVLVAADPSANVRTVFARLGSVFVSNVAVVLPTKDDDAVLVYRDDAPPCESRPRGSEVGAVNVTLVGRWSEGSPALDEAWQNPSVEGCAVRVSVNPQNDTYFFASQVAESVLRFLGTKSIDISTLPLDNVTTRLPNGSWTGILGALERREVDVGLILQPTHERVKHFRTSTMVSATPTKVWLRCPAETLSGNVVVGDTTLFVLVLTVTVVLALFAVVVLGSRVSGGRSDTKTPLLRACGRSAMEALATFLEQPLDRTEAMTRMTLALILYSTWLLNNFLKSTITSERSRKLSAYRVPNLEGLSRDGQVVGIFFPVVRDNFMLAAGEIPGLRPVARRFQMCSTNASDCIAHFREDRTSYYGLAASGLDYLREIIHLWECIYEVPQALDNSMVFMYTRLDDPLGPLLDRAMIRLHTMGLPAYLVKKLTWDFSDNSLSEPKAEHIEYYVMGWTLVVGYLAGVVAFLHELTAAQPSSRRRRRRPRATHRRARKEPLVLMPPVASSRF